MKAVGSASALAVAAFNAGQTAATLPKKRQDLHAALARVQAVEKAGRLVGRAVLAERSGIPERTMRAYAKVENKLPDSALVFIARALRGHAAEVIAHAEAVEAMVAEGRP